MTADSSYTVIAGTESRQQLYVALTRGRHTNHAFVTVTADGDPHTALTRDGVLPPTAIDVLQRILDRDDTPRSATSTAADQDDPARQLATEVGRYLHSLATAVEDQLGTDGLASIDRAAETTVPGLTDALAYPALRANLALHAAAGGDARSLLREAADDPRSLDGARDAAAVLDWRMGAPTPDGPPPPLPWLPAVPLPVAGDPVWGSYMDRRTHRVRDLATAVADGAMSWTADSAPSWARPYLVDSDLVRDLAVWRAAAGVDLQDPRPTGRPNSAAADLGEQRLLDSRVRDCASTLTAESAVWAARLRDAAPDLAADPFWPVLLDRVVDRRLADLDGTALGQALARNPLPDELPAAALWWRLVEYLPVRTAASEAHVLAVGSASPTVDAVVQTADHGDVGPSRVRVLQLNKLAADFFAKVYAGSWAQDHLNDRLGADAAQATNHLIGYAPEGWTDLIDHLRGQGANDDELLEAGLASRASNGRLIDRFRDRVMFAIRDDDGIVGWIGRRHPDTDHHPHPAVPKYLNTAETAAFTKGQHLFGLTESRARINQGAVPVLVERPVDALAVSLAGDGRFVGVAPLGTAFTDRQTDRLRGAVADDQPRIVVGMDADHAGRRSAAAMFWLLTEWCQTSSVQLPDGQDPAGLLHDAGPSALLRALEAPPGLPDVLIGDIIHDCSEQLHTVEGQVVATRRAARVIAAVPVNRWPALLTQVVAGTGIAPDIALAEALDAAEDRPPAGGATQEVMPTARGGSSCLASRPVHVPAECSRAVAGVEPAGACPESRSMMRSPRLGHRHLMRGPPTCAPGCAGRGVTTSAPMPPVCMDACE